MQIYLRPSYQPQQIDSVDGEVKGFSASGFKVSSEMKFDVSQNLISCFF